jgi:type IV pilus assembly protein PilX
MLDAQVAHQAAEAALRDAEQDLKLLEGQMPTGAVCSRGATRPVSGGMQIFTADCARGQCDGSVSNKPGVDYGASVYTAANSEPWWPVDKGGRWNNEARSKPSASDGSSCQTFVGGVPLGTYTGAVAIPGVAKAPEYLLERFTRGSAVYFRITARGFGYSVATQAVLQSYFRVPNDL